MTHGWKEQEMFFPSDALFLYTQYRVFFMIQSNIRYFILAKNYRGGGGILGVVPVRKWKQRAFPAFNRSSLYKRKGGGMGRRFEAAALSKIYSGYRIKERLKND